MKQKWITLTLLLLTSLLFVATGSAAEHKKAAHAGKKIILTPDELQWKEGPSMLPGSKMALLDGNPEKPGFFVARLKFPAGMKIKPHVHGNVERVTVISGKLNLAMGDKAENATALPAGSYISLPPGTLHNAWVDEETVVQISTNGPWKTRMATSGEGKSTGPSH